MTLAIDFDGVIHEYSKGWNGGEMYDPPVEGTKEALQTLKDAGHKIYIFTTRTNKAFRKKDDPDQTKLLQEYLDKYQIPYDKIWTYGKPMADIFIDDRAINFSGNWKETVQQIEVFKPWNKSD